jgi:hypothetical protein
MDKSLIWSNPTGLINFHLCVLLNDKQRITHCDEKRIIHTEQAANNTLGLYPFTTWAEEIKEGIFFFFLYIKLHNTDGCC